ncbi:serine/threonine-protein kinase [Methanofollis ethanolicus]|uniref:serine/threonine-protein kinase n=1 Tax=Methanofollis ethanolicus TaxID=488124 RepID=UPI001365C700|nr:serine/threonine-protein kinase [Methanofollis ethanolicus]
MSGEAPPSVRIGNGFPSELEERYGDAELVGRGGMALVFRAQRRSDGKMVAVKVPTRYDEATGHCFMKEMQIWKQLRHKNIVEVYTYNILPVPFVEMEFVGPSLAERKVPVPVGEAVSIVRGVAEGLAYAHAAGLIHRDIKPGNILIAPDGTPKITDWGLGKEVADRKETQFIAFSLDYATPEQISPSTYGRADARTDIFQMGVVFYELLTGRVPFSGDGMGEMSVAILTDAPLPPSRIMENLGAFDAIVLKCLEKTQENRYQSIEDLLSDLDALPGGPNGSDDPV